MENTQDIIQVSVKLPTSSDLFKKHFSNVYGGAGVGIFHPNIEPFFEELNQVCLIEDAIKKINNTTKTNQHE
jgi:hypothetical protein